LANASSPNASAARVSEATTGIDGETLSRPVSFLVARRSGDNHYLACHVVNGAWAEDADLTGAIAPQWDPTTGRVEPAIPRSALATGTTADGTTEPLVVELEHQNPTTQAWTADSSMTLRCRLTSAGTPPLYGNVR